MGCSKNDSDESSNPESNEEENSNSDYAAAPTPVEGALTGTAALGAPLIKSNVNINNKLVKCFECKNVRPNDKK